MTFLSKEKYDRIYRQVNAMYHKDFTIDEICDEFPNIPRFEIIEMTQKIFGREMLKKERSR